MKKHPWERRDEESEEAFAAFLVYRGMGVKRSARGAAVLAEATGTGEAPFAERPGIWAKWCHANDWVDRARAYDDHKHREADDAKLAEIRDTMSELAEQNKKVIRLAYRRILEVLALPATRQTVTKKIEVAGQSVDQTIVIEGANYRLSDLASIIEKADKIMRLFIGDPTERVAAHMQIGLAVMAGKELADVIASPAQRAMLMEVAERVVNSPDLH